MSICMYPAVASADRLNPDYVSQGERNAEGSVQKGSAVVPGDVIFSSVANLITGHGTYRKIAHGDSYSQKPHGSNMKGDEDEKELIPGVSSNQHLAEMRTSLSGRVRIVNKLVYVEPPKARYFGNVGDAIVGRIIEVDKRRWRVDINSALQANLALANVKLPGGELRRKSEEDERAMRSFMKEGDLIVAEIHEVHKDGTLQLHMPGTRTGKLGGGCLLRIPPSLVKRQKIHRHRLAVPRSDSVSGQSVPMSATPTEVISVGLILGCNGYVWIGPARAMDIGVGLAAPANPDSEMIDKKELLAERIAVCRVRNCILALTRHGMPVWETNVLAACEASWLADQQDDEDDDYDTQTEPTGKLTIQNRIARLLHPELSRHLVSLVEAKLKSS